MLVKSENLTFKLLLYSIKIIKSKVTKNFATFIYKHERVFSGRKVQSATFVSR